MKNTYQRKWFDRITWPLIDLRRIKTQSLVYLLSFLVIISGISLVSATSSSANMGTECQEISMMPGEIFVTYAKDISFPQLAQSASSSLIDQSTGTSPILSDPHGLVDIHSFNQYFTFQIDKHSTGNQVDIDEPSSMQSSFKAPRSSGEGYLFKIKVELSSAFSDQVQQGMRVTLIDTSKGNYAILVDGTSLDNDFGSVYLEYPDMKDGQDYIVRYDLYDKEIMSNGDELGSLTQTSTNVMCKLPFITQELLIIDKRLAKHRIAEHNRNVESGSGRTTDVSESGIQCEFDHLNNTDDLEYGEDGVSCENKLYSYQTQYQSSSNTKYSKIFVDKESKDKQYRLVYEHQFSVRGSKNELITYWYEMLVGVNFLVSSSLKVILTRDDKEFVKEDPFSCMYDKSCVVATMSQKNQIKLDLILTSGKYKLRFLDEESKAMQKFLNSEANINQRPFSFSLRSFPVLQNENRVNCPYMYMERDFIQQRFIEGKKGKKFSFKDKIIMNIFNLTQQFDFIPEQDMLLKIRIKEAYGVNTEMVLCEEPDNCLVMSTQVGTSEILFAQLDRGQKYYVELSFAKSLIQLSEFFTCPHFQIEINMIRVSEADQIILDQSKQIKYQDFDSQEALADIFSNVTQGDAANGFAFIDHKQLFNFTIVQTLADDNAPPNFEVTTVKFVAYEKAQLSIEIFYDSYFHDLELSLLSLDASNVRSHLATDSSTYSPPGQNIDWSLYKGSKSIFVELEAGAYDLKITQKLPYISESSPLKKYQMKAVQFQLYMIYAAQIEKQQILPPSLNYLGMIGPNGQNFGEFTYSCLDCTLEKTRYKIIEFEIQETSDKRKKDVDMNFNAEISSFSKDVEVKFELAEDGETRKYGNYDVIFDDQTKKGLSTGNIMRIYKGQSEETEESISASTLKSNSRYRIVILNVGESQQVTFNLRLEIIESPNTMFSTAKKGSQQQVLPKKIDEIKREKLKGQGVKESEFIIGNRFMMKWMDEDQLYPFLKKNNQVYQTQYIDSKTEAPFMLTLPFEVKEEQSQIYASVFDYSGVASLGLMIVMADDPENQWEVASVPAKYYSYIEPTTLTRGSYILIVTPMTEFDFEQPDHMIRFSLDFLYERENTTDVLQQFILNTMEMCNIPSLPRSLSSSETASYIHALNGQSMSQVFKMAMSDVYSQDTITFDIQRASLVTIYLETPKDVEVELELLKVKGVYKRRASSKDLNKDMDNFLKSTQYKHANIVQIRDFAIAGSYKLKIKAQDQDGYTSSSMPRCQSALLHFSVQPTPTGSSSSLAQSSSLSVFPSATSLTSQCKEVTLMGQKLKFGEFVHGFIVQSLSQKIFDSSYISLEDQGEGPFFLYFQIEYDAKSEGVMGLGLYQHNKELQSFTEVQSYVVHDHASYLLAIVEQGVYVLAVNSLSSVEDKFTVAKSLTYTGGPSQQMSSKSNFLLHQPCLNISFTYYVTSAIEHDSQTVDFTFTDFLSALFLDDEDNKFAQLGKQVSRDKTLRQEFGDVMIPSCRYEEMPKQLEATESGYDYTYSLAFTKKSSQIIDILVEDLSLFKVMFSMTNPRNNLNAFLYDSSEMKNLIALTRPSVNQKEILISLKPQKKAYVLKIVEDTIDETDTCPYYQMRTALKPIPLVTQESLKCTGQGMPPSTIKLDGNNSAIDGSYQISSEFIQKYTSKQMRAEKNGISFDMKVIVQDAQKDYYFDIESKYDFLTADIEVTLFAQTADTPKELIKLGESSWYDEELQDTSMIEETPNESNIVKRLKVANARDEIDSDVKLSNTYIVRIKFSSKMLGVLKIIPTATQNASPYCFSFDLSIRVTEITKAQLQSYTPESDPTLNELIRIDWSNKMSEQLFDPRQKLSVFLQFKDSMREEYKTLKFSPFAYLTEIEDNNEKSKKIKSSTEASKIKIYPETVRLSTLDKSTLVLTFLHNTLEKATCYKLILDVQQMGVRYDEGAFKAQNKLCTTKCQCNLKGMSGCDEKSGKCYCHEPFTGRDCTKCSSGFVFNPQTQDCHPVTKCKQNGGLEECNGHGECYEDEVTGQAKCICSRGFADDGLDLCSKCSDPLFTYPNCESRNWIIEESQYQCEKLETVMPFSLFNDSDSKKTKTYQNQDGLAYWSGVYKLLPPTHQQQQKQNHFKTMHLFQVPTNSIVRLFLDTHNSGVKAKFKILDDMKRVIAQSLIAKNEEESLSQQNTEMFFSLVPQSSSITKNGKKRPYSLQLDFEFQKLEMGPNICHMIELQFIVQPFDRMNSYLKCTPDELQDSQQTTQKQHEFRFSSQPYFFNEKFTVSSDARASKEGYVAEINDRYVVLRYEIGVDQSGNALSIMTRYSLEKMALELNLKDKQNGEIVATERFSSLENFEVQGGYSADMTDDMLSYIEIPSIDQGEYFLEILISKALFLSKAVTGPKYQQKQVDPSCLSFELTLEYVPRRSESSQYSISSSSDDSNGQKYEVVAVVPYYAKELKKGRKVKIQLKLSDSQISLDSDETNGLKEFIYLQGIDDSGIKIQPSNVMATNEDTLTLYFNLQYTQLKDDKVNNEICFKLILSEEQFKPLNIQTKYCIQPTLQQDILNCNPNALAKVVNNQCLCTYPYKGSKCEECANGYNQIIDQQSQHSICSLDLSKCSSDICNGHGTCQQIAHSGQGGSYADFKCECQSKFSGTYCEKCKDSQFAYPDCETQRSEILEIDFEKDLLERRQYHSENGFSNKASDLNKNIQAITKGFYKQQCQIATYPYDLDRVEFMSALSGGEVHLADYYTVNHDTDNIIKFTPRQQGVIKVFIQQPELEEAEVNDESFDIEIGLWDAEGKKFLKSSINRHVDFNDNKHVLNGKQDNAWLQMQIPYDKVNKTLFIIFRAVNFKLKAQTQSPISQTNNQAISSYSQNGDSSLSKSGQVSDNSEQQFMSSCETVYIEIQYTEHTRTCQNNQDLSFNSRDVIKVDSYTPYKSYGKNNMNSGGDSQSLQSQFYSLSNNYKPFYWYQDFYLGSQTQTDVKEGDYEIKISIHQKFIEENLIDFVVEVLEEGIPYSEIDLRKYQTVADKPDCLLICQVGGQKAYNEIHNVIQVSAQSLVRVWLHQSSKEGQCANYQLFLEANKIQVNQNQLESLEDLRCEELDLPSSFNVHRYLGSPEDTQNSNDNTQQKNFHYLETFRVDNLRNNQAHLIAFTLYEPSLIRVLTTVHKHIEFDILLRQIIDQENSFSYGKKLIDSKAKNYEDSIFAQLDKGKYELMLQFLSEEFFMQQPCQSIQFEIGIVKVADAKQSLQNQQNRQSSSSQIFSQFNLQEILISSEENNSKHRQIVHPSDNGLQKTVSTYAFIDSNLQKDYKSFIELSNQKFSIPRVKDLGVIITLKSDFMLNNVNFALTNLNNQRLLSNNHRRENLVQLVAKNIPGGEYELLIYAHNCLSNIQNEGSMIREIGVWFEIEIQFVKWVEKDDFVQHYLYVEIMNKTLKSEIETLFNKQLKCYQETIELPSEIRPLLATKDKVDINYEARIPNDENSFEHVMEYVPQSGQDALRVIVDHQNVKIKVKRNLSDKDPLHESYSLSSGDQQMLLAQALQSNQKYFIIYEFSQESQDESSSALSLSQEDLMCDKFRIQIESFNMKDQCLRSQTNNKQDIIYVKDKTDITFVHESNRLKSYQKISIDGTEQMELWITVDFSQALFLPQLKLSKLPSQSQLKKDKKIILIQSQEVYSEIQELMIYKFTNLKQGEYFINVTQFGKPKDCQNKIPLRIQAQSMNSGLMLQQTKYGMVKTYTSEQEISELNRYVQPLPISLDTYKYLVDEDYMLVSEYISIQSERPEDNKIVFKIKNRDETQKTYFRVYVENGDILISLKSKQKDIEKLVNNVITAKLENGEYYLTFEYSTKQAFQKASLFKSSFHVTIMTITQSYFEKNYLNYQGGALKNCQQNTNFPLALSKTKALQYYPNEIVFDYQMLRISDKVLTDNYVIDDYKFRINETSRFYFTVGMHAVAHQIIMRVSELSGYGNQYMGKQEFNINVMDVILSPGDYKITVEQPITYQWGENDKQNNITKGICGVFSFSGRITPIEDYASSTVSSGKQISSKCQIKEVFPSEVYSSPEKTKNGLEPHVNKDGTYNQVFKDIHIRKNKRSMKKPEFDRIQIQPPETGLLSILLQYQSKSNEILVKLFDAYSFAEKSQEPLTTSQSEALKGVIEVNHIFKIEKDRSYFLFIYYKGEPQVSKDTNDEICEYFNAFISIDTMSRLIDEFSCLNEANDKIAVFMRDLPQRVTDSDLKDGKYTFKDFTQIRYPQDYSTSTQLQITPKGTVSGEEEDKQLMRRIEIKLRDQFSVDAKIKFDFPYALFDLSIFDNLKSDDNDPDSSADDYQLMAEQSPIKYNQQDFSNPTLLRQLSGKMTQPNNVYYLLFTDDISQTLLETVYSHLQTINKDQTNANQQQIQQLCLYTEVEFTIKMASQNIIGHTALAQVNPQILSIQPAVNPENPLAPYILPRDQNLIMITVLFNRPPFMKGQKQQQSKARLASKSQLSDLVNLQILNPQSNDLIYAKKPVKMQFKFNKNDQTKNSENDESLNIQFYFDITEENQPSQPQYLLKPFFNLEQMVDQKEQPFILTQNLQLPTFTKLDKIDENEKKEQQEENKSELDILKQKIIDQNEKLSNLNLTDDGSSKKKEEEKRKQKRKVECLCVHGKCREGEAYCNQCDDGWTGRLCDIPKDGQNENNINNRDGENGGVIQRHKKKQYKKDGTQMVRDRDDNYQNDYYIKDLDLNDDLNQQDINYKKRKDNNGQSSADTTLQRDKEFQELLDRKRRDDDLMLSKRDQNGRYIANEQQTQGLVARFMKTVGDLFMTALVIAFVLALVYFLLKKSRIKDYMPVPINERDDDEHARQLELTDFSIKTQKDEESSQLRARRRQKQQQSYDHQTTEVTKQQRTQRATKTGEYPSDIMGQLRQSNEKIQNQKSEEQRELLKHDEQFDQETQQLTSELELYANDDEEQHSGKRLRENPSTQQNLQQDNYSAQQPQWAQMQFLTTSGAGDGGSENHFSSSSDKQPQYYYDSQSSSTHQPFIESSDQYNPFSYVDFSQDNLSSQAKLNDPFTKAGGIQPQQLSEIAATSHEIDSVLQEMQDETEEDLDDEDYDDNFEQKRLF